VSDEIFDSFRVSLELSSLEQEQEKDSSLDEEPQRAQPLILVIDDKIQSNSLQ